MEARQPSAWARFGRTVVVVGGGMLLMLCCFMCLPLLQAITKPASPDLDVRSADTVTPPPPPPPVEDEPEKDEEPPPPPSVANDAPPLDLSQLELALDPGFGGAGGVGGFALPMGALVAKGLGNMGNMFDFGALEERPRPIFRAKPQITRAMSKRMPATVTILMTITVDGRVENPIVQASDDPIFEGPALNAIRQWKFEAGKRRGKPDVFRVRQVVTFK